MYPSGKLSNETPYPFTPAISDADLPAIAGILDAYLVVAGAASVLPVAVASPEVTLTSVTISGASIVYSFRADYGLQRYVNTITIPRSGGIQQVTTTGYPLITLLVDTERLPTSSYPGITAVVEPSRVVWDHEVVASLTFKNVRRSSGVENFNTLLTVLTLSPGPGNPGTLRLIDGYNTEFRYTDGELLLNVDAELGQGASLDYGNTAESPVVDTRPILQCVNGLLPLSGDIPIYLSDALGIETGDGTLTITRRA